MSRLTMLSLSIVTVPILPIIFVLPVTLAIAGKARNFYVSFCSVLDGPTTYPLIHMCLFRLCCLVLCLDDFASEVSPENRPFYELPHWAMQSISNAGKLIPVWT